MTLTLALALVLASAVEFTLVLFDNDTEYGIDINIHAQFLDLRMGDIGARSWFPHRRDSHEAP